MKSSPKIESIRYQQPFTHYLTMIVTQDYFDCYVHILRENGSYGDSLLTILEDIINGEWDRSVEYRLQYKDVNYDPMDDFNYPGSRHHYW